MGPIGAHRTLSEPGGIFLDVRAYFRLIIFLSVSLDFFKACLAIKSLSLSIYIYKDIYIYIYTHTHAKTLKAQESAPGIRYEFPD